MRSLLPSYFVALTRLFFWSALVGVQLASPASAIDLKRLSVVEVETTLATPIPKLEAFRLEGIIRAVVPETGVMALQDESGTVLFQLPVGGTTVSVGQQLVIVASPGIVARKFFGVRIENRPVVDNDGSHSKLEMSGSAFLEAGLNPIRLDWFNGPAEYELSVEYEGPGIPRQQVPDSILLHASTNLNGLQPGIGYRAYGKSDIKKTHGDLCQASGCLKWMLREWPPISVRIISAALRTAGSLLTGSSRSKDPVIIDSTSHPTTAVAFSWVSHQGLYAKLQLAVMAYEDEVRLGYSIRACGLCEHFDRF